MGLYKEAERSTARPGGAAATEPAPRRRPKLLPPHVRGTAGARLAGVPPAGSDGEIVQEEIPFSIQASAEHVENQILKVLRPVGGPEGQTLSLIHI